ncbi:unnamed protein product [marine sediment metagenome]|uniref:site-specific DNA-methyltransferase (adenine-specific) n=1 Tax=marine sediment metagenome TaxID=412755 RepID=X1J7I4_9ZZZZ
MHENLLVDNFKIDGDDIKWKIELIGMEVDRQTNILAKANMLIHLAETYKELNNRQKRKFVDLMNQTFLLTDHTKVLGALEFPQKDRFDLILSNPPFTVSGTKVIKEQISESNELKDQYEQSGIGTESLFLRWIIDALKPNCQAFVIVPTGILTRTETAARGYLLKHCVLDAIISLPENTFYNTSNPTYILAFTKKERVDEHTDISEEVPEKDVFAYLVREIGETRDTLRLPCQSDLKDMTRQFRAFYSDREVFEARNINCKIIPKTNLEAKDRWDVDRFWTDKEKQELGLIGKITTMSLDEFESIIEVVSEPVLKLAMDAWNVAFSGNSFFITCLTFEQ